MLIALSIQVRPATSAPRASLIGPIAATGAEKETSASMVPSAATLRVERDVGRMAVGLRGGCRERYQIGLLNRPIR